MKKKSNYLQGLLKNKAKKTQLFPTSFAQLGKPIANTQFLVLDSHLNLVPSGFPGELYIGGSGLARGYLHRGDLTAARFIPNPTPPHKGRFFTFDHLFV